MGTQLLENLASLLLIEMPFVPSSFFFLVVRPGAPSSVLVASRKRSQIGKAIQDSQDPPMLAPKEQATQTLLTKRNSFSVEGALQSNTTSPLLGLKSVIFQAVL